MEGKGDKATAEGMELLRGEVDKLKEHVKISEDGVYAFFFASHALGWQLFLNSALMSAHFLPALKASHSEADILKKQMDSLAREYDRLLKEHQELQVTLPMGHYRII